MKEIVYNSQNLSSFYVFEIHKSSLNKNEELDLTLKFIECKIDLFEASTLIFKGNVFFKNCHIGKLNCYSTYFLNGLSIIDSTIENETTFESGGHNISPQIFSLQNNTFNGFVDFDDIYFSGPVNISHNKFIKGSNLHDNLTIGSGIKAGERSVIINNTL